MPRFQSRLFNWIDHSWPVQLGRSVRRSLDQKFQQLAGLSLEELPRLLAYQVARAALYPVYLIASTLKRTFPALNRGKTAVRENLQPRPESILLTESEDIAENFEDRLSQELALETDLKVEINSDFLKPEIPLFLRPLTKFLDWLDRTKSRLDQSITAIVKRSSDDLATSNNPELEPKWIANRIFAEIWRQQIEQKQAEQNSLKENNGLTENVALGKNIRLEQLRRLIEAAIAYFFGSQPSNPSPQDQKLQDKEEVAEIFGAESGEALPNSPQLKKRQVNPARSSDRLSNQIDSGNIKENSPLAESRNLQRLRDLIAAAIDYFIGKRSLDGKQNISPDGIDGNQPDLLQTFDKLQSSGSSSVNYQANSEENSDGLKIDNQFERLQKIIEAAIAYFFGKTQPTLDETSDMAISEPAWLTMEDLFRDDNGPWPLPLEYESIAFNKSPDRHTIHSSGELQNFETTTSQISQDQLEGGLFHEEEDLLYHLQNSGSESDRPLKAWLEAQTTILGYVYNPVMAVILVIDDFILKIENLIIKLWKGLIRFPKRLINFIRYGKS